MGIEGLTNFLRNENQIVPIDIRREVNKWKRTHRGQEPILVMDFLSVSNGIVGQFKDQFVYGGRHRHIQEYLKSLLLKFLQIGCRLVFFSDYNIQVGKQGEWLRRRNLEFKKCTDLYDWIGDGKTPEEMCKMPRIYRLALKSLCYEMELIAQIFGEMNYTIKHECDLEILRYAKQNNAMAIVSCDTDFLMFDGSWRLWSSDDIKIKSGNLVTCEYNKTAIETICSLTKKQLPLLATLIGNDFTKAHRNSLNAFHRTLGEPEDKVKNVARFIRQLDRNELTDIDIAEIFGNAFDEIRVLIEKSLESYKIDDDSTAIITDPIAMKLLGTLSYPAYMTIMGPIHGINMNFYDMRGCGEGVSLSKLSIGWLQRKIGLLRKQNNDESFTFTLLAKKSLDEDYAASEEKPIYPEFSVPPLDDLYLNNTDLDIIEFRYKILGWIMGIPDEIIRELKHLRKFSAKRATLYVLVKNGLIDVCEADCILYTEVRSLEDSRKRVKYPTKINPNHIRVAQIYNISFTNVRQNFEIAGLLPLRHFERTDIGMAEIVSQFDGIYFQNLMEKVTHMNHNERDEFFSLIKNYRIYADDQAFC
ncbi:uncharacterized protein LOC129573498 [Sitodiplosis mosellana]|uniref:uncharacterized protein LOC129573498 n=1 Tax=Sitodiplosis mosellana TaxID=263140 RepID=UPI002443FC1A|nr:uncharacterized protein LOC129573498 [Sitodiplosis mosellana]